MLNAALALILIAQDAKADLAKAIEKFKTAKSYAFKGHAPASLDGGPDTEGEFEGPAVWSIRRANFEVAQSGDKNRYQIIGQAGERKARPWSDPSTETSGKTLWHFVGGYLFMFRPDLLLEIAGKADKVEVGKDEAIDGVECKTYSVDALDKDLHTAVLRFMPEIQKRAWKNIYEPGKSKEAPITIEIVVDPNSGWVRRVELRYWKGGVEGSAGINLDGFDNTKAKVPKELRKELGLGEG